MTVSYIHQGAITIGILLLVYLPSAAPQVVLNGTIDDGDGVCAGHVITFTCETTASGTIAWSSNEYIGPGSFLRFAAIDDLDEIRTSDISSDTFATFISKANTDTSPVLVSQLHINVSSNFPTSSVTCTHFSTGLTNIINFQLLGEPGMLQPRNLEQRMHPFKDGICTLFLSWDLMQDVTKYMVFFNGNHIDTTRNTSYALLVYCDSHTVRLRAINRCGQMSPNAPDVAVLPERFLYSDITTEQESVGGGSTEQAAVDVLVPGLLSALIIILFIIVIVLGSLLIWSLFFKKSKTNQPVEKGEDHTLEPTKSKR